MISRSCTEEANSGNSGGVREEATMSSDGGNSGGWRLSTNITIQEELQSAVVDTCSTTLGKDERR
jgi:hypothetical protein